MVDRRRFFRVSAAACGALLDTCAARTGTLFAEARADSLRLALIGPARAADAESAARGVTLGIEEAARTGALMGRAAELRTVTAGEADSLAREWLPAGLIGGFDAESAVALSATAERAGVPFLNIGSSADVLRGEQCSRGLFHVQASEAMYSSAAATLKDLPPGAVGALWHEELERFGAGQLNARFRARFGAGMDGQGWAGWMAVKVLWEASLRARSTRPEELLAYLRRESTQFDGHKGMPLSFRAWDQQLRQPLYFVQRNDAATRVVAEAPTRPESAEVPTRELLDRFGATSSTSTCKPIRGEAP